MIYKIDKKLREVKQTFISKLQPSGLITGYRFLETWLREFSPIDDFYVDVEIEDIPGYRIELVNPVSCNKYLYDTEIQNNPQLNNRNIKITKGLPYSGIFSLQELFVNINNIINYQNPGTIILEDSGRPNLDQLSREVNGTGYFVIAAYRELTSPIRVGRINSMFERFAEILFPYSLYLNNVEEIPYSQLVFEKQKMGEFYIYKFNLRMVDNFN